VTACGRRVEPFRKALSHIDPRALIAHEDTISFEPTALTTDAIVFGDLIAQPGAESLEQAIALGFWSKSWAVIP
jgi:hypothetical protein